MRIVTKGAEFALKEMLEGIAPQRTIWRGQLFRSPTSLSQHTASILQSTIGEMLAGEQGAAFLFEDGDIFILCHAVPRKFLDRLAGNLSKLLNLSESDVQLYDLGTHWEDIHPLTTKKAPHEHQKQTPSTHLNSHCPHGRISSRDMAACFRTLHDTRRLIASTS